MSKEAGAAEQDRAVDGDAVQHGVGPSSDAASAIGQTAQVRKGPLSCRKGESASAAVGQRSAKAVLGTGPESPVLRKIPAV